MKAPIYPKAKHMEIEEFKAPVENALRKLYSIDAVLFSNDVNERSLVGRLAMYLREELLWLEKENIMIDLEYNREGIGGNNPKEIMCKNNSGEKNSVYVVPDIVIHERGTSSYDEPDKNRNNIICCEVKKGQEDDHDITKIIGLIKKYQYSYGIVMPFLSKKRCEFTVYDDKAEEIFVCKYNIEHSKIISYCNMQEKL